MIPTPSRFKMDFDDESGDKLRKARSNKKPTITLIEE